MHRNIGVIIPAAGSARRLGGISKPLIKIGSEPAIIRLVRLFAGLQSLKCICISTTIELAETLSELVESAGQSHLVRIVQGGDERPVSVRKGFEEIRDDLREEDLVCIHDAARPLLSNPDLNRVIDAADRYQVAFLATRVKDTLKRVDSEGYSEATVDRRELFAAQTPQVMTKVLLSKAYRNFSDLTDATDEIILMEKMGIKSKVVEAEHLNMKITTTEDLELLAKIIS